MNARILSKFDLAPLIAAFDSKKSLCYTVIKRESCRTRATRRKEPGMPGISDRAYRILRRPFAFVWRTRLLGRENIPSKGPAVFVANHLGSYAPIAVLAALPVRLYPWVAHQVTEPKLCPEYLRHDFIEPELHLKPPLSRAAAWLISKACLAVMKALEAIPVYPGSMKLEITWKRSLDLLEQGRFIIIFPENDKKPLSGPIHEFYYGFVRLGALYYEQTGRRLDFVPIAVNKSSGTIRAERPNTYDPSSPLPSERFRIVSELQETITALVGQPGS